MSKACEILLNGIALTSAVPVLLITEVKHETAKISGKWEPLAQRDAQFRNGSQRSGCTVTVEFVLPVRDYAKRQACCQRVIAWAKDGGVLQSADRPGQHLVCECEQYPNIGSVKNIGDTLTVKFAGHEQPFWEEDGETIVTMTGTDEETDASIPGNAGDALVEVTVTPGSSTVDSVTVTVGETSITLEDLAATASTPITITYSNGIQRIRKGSTSILNKRTAASSDDLVAVCGRQNHFAMEANASATATFRVRGVWL